MMSPFQNELKLISPIHYAACLFAPSTKRDALVTLYRFDAEIKRIPTLVSEPMLGEIRLVWWQEALNGERAGEAHLNPLASAILDLIATDKLPLTAFQQVIEGEIQSLETMPLADQRELEADYGRRFSVVFQLAAMILDPDAAQKAAVACGHSGIAYGIACDLAFHRHAVRRNEIVELGEEHFGKARAAISGIPNTLRSAFLPLVVVDPILRKAGRVPQSEAVAMPSYLMSLWRMLRYKI
jgi:15-cis-phytoene synthase